MLPTMRKFIFMLLIFLFSSSQAITQVFALKGLEIYNPVFQNPAFTSSEKIIQTDLIAYDIWYYNGFWLNAMSNLPNTKSSLGLNFGGSKYFNNYSFSGGDRSNENVYAQGKSMGLSYAYTHSFSEQLKLSGGINFSHSILNVSDTTTNLLSRNAGFLNTGVKLSYRKLYVGISARTGLYAWKKILNEENETEVIRDGTSAFSSNFIAAYSMGGQRRVNFDPVIGFQYYKDFSNDNSDFGFYAGGNICIMKTIGLGFTVGDMFSLSTSITVLDRVSLMLGIYENERDIHLASLGYTLKFDPFRFIAQLRIKL